MTNYNEPLTPWTVSVHMVHSAPEKPEQRQTYSIVVPAVDEEHAAKSGYELGYVIGTASGWQWKFANIEPAVEATLTVEASVAEEAQRFLLDRGPTHG